MEEPASASSRMKHGGSSFLLNTPDPCIHHSYTMRISLKCAIPVVCM